MTIRTLAHDFKSKLDKHRPLIEVSISQENLLHNFRTYQKKYPSLAFAPVLKSNAYGHGLAVIARLLDKEKIPFFMVDSFYEARALRRAGLSSRILIMGYVQPTEIAQSTLKKIDFAVVDIEQLRDVVQLSAKSRSKRVINIHLKIDTGMHRHGLMPDQLDEAIALLTKHPRLRVVGVASHFADADTINSKHTAAQSRVWNDSCKKLTGAFPSIEFRDIAATKGVSQNNVSGSSEKTNASTVRDANVARLGIGLYGFDTSPDGSTELKPVMEVRSLISSIRGVPAHDFVGYNATYTAATARRIATVPIGYFEGVDRRLSNKGFFIVRGERCPIVGRVSMNMTSIDVTDVPEVARGDIVTVISRNPADPNSVENIAKLVSGDEYTETPYVVLVHVPQHLKRVVE
jgi:alanine racemase